MNQNLKPKILTIIPARGGSKGIPRKNIKLLKGKPLIYYTIKESLKSDLLDKIIVSTEDVEMLQLPVNTERRLLTDLLN